MMIRKGLKVLVVLLILLVIVSSILAITLYFILDGKASSTYNYNIVEDNADLEKALAAAVEGEWDTAMPILQKKPYLVNCIPEDRAWSVLHHAVYWNNTDILLQILDINTCDALIKTKETLKKEVEPSSTPVELAEQLGGRNLTIQILNRHLKNVREERFSGNLIYMVRKEDGESIVDRLPLFMKAVIMYKDALLGDKWPKEHLADLLKEILAEVQDNWYNLEQKLHQAMYGIDHSSANNITNSTSGRELFQKIVRYYTGPKYRSVNHAVSRDFSNATKPTAEDCAIALYDLLLDAIIMYWDGLNSINSTTYRGVNAKLDFTVGSEVMFTYFLSSSTNESQARIYSSSEGTLMIIDNSASSDYRPKSIEHLSYFSVEKEHLYGIGAGFRVTDVDNSSGLRTIHLKLI